MAAALRRDVSRLRRERMAGLALSLPRVLGARAVAAENVDPARNGLEVVPVHAPAVATGMIGLESGWDRALEEFVGDLMGLDVATQSGGPEPPIPGLWADVPRPAPARRGVLLIDVLPESFFRRSGRNAAAVGHRTFGPCYRLRREVQNYTGRLV